MSLTTLRLPAVVRAATELAEETHRYRAEDHPAIVAAQADPENHPEPSFDEQMAWHDALHLVTEAANRLKRALGATGKLDPASTLDTREPPAWPNLASRFLDLDYPRPVRVGLLRLAYAAIDLSGFGAMKRPPEEWRVRGLSQLDRGLVQVWTALSADEVSEVRPLLPVLRAQFGWTKAPTDAPPAWTGPVDIAPEEEYRVYSTTDGFYARTREYVENTIAPVLATAPNTPPAAGPPAAPAAPPNGTEPAETPLERILAAVKHKERQERVARELALRMIARSITHGPLADETPAPAPVAPSPTPPRPVPPPLASHPLATERVRNWLAAQYLNDPAPDHLDTPDGPRIVLVPLAAFTGFLLEIGADVLATLDACVAVGWTHDMRVDVYPAEVTEPTALNRVVQRLRLPIGRHRILGIMPTTLVSPLAARGDPPVVVPAAPLLERHGKDAGAWVSRCGGALQCSPDCGTVRRGEEVFTFTSGQRACVERMIDAWERGRKVFTKKELLDFAGSTGDSVRNIFRGSGSASPAWNNLIVPADGIKGSYALRLEPRPGGAWPKPAESPPAVPG